jgi:hypothetical protein
MWDGTWEAAREVPLSCGQLVPSPYVSFCSTKVVESVVCKCKQECVYDYTTVIPVYILRKGGRW